MTAKNFVFKDNRNTSSTFNKFKNICEVFAHLKNNSVMQHDYENFASHSFAVDSNLYQQKHVFEIYFWKTSAREV